MSWKFLTDEDEFMKLCLRAGSVMLFFALVAIAICGTYGAIRLVFMGKPAAGDKPAAIDVSAHNIELSEGLGGHLELKEQEFKAVKESYETRARQYEEAIKRLEGQLKRKPTAPAAHSPGDECQKELEVCLQLNLTLRGQIKEAEETINLLEFPDVLDTHVLPLVEGTKVVNRYLKKKSSRFVVAIGASLIITPGDFTPRFGVGLFAGYRII